MYTPPKMYTCNLFDEQYSLLFYYLVIVAIFKINSIFKHSMYICIKIIIECKQLHLGSYRSKHTSSLYFEP